ncbi:hypothetical protein [Nocardioides taihuensis]|uniref:WD40 repeat domain-containing protein n=1 Tax=Nocardioides taihuensis TaxID=1835606 RepID=A0ABW0BM00_9ACTN
MDTLRDRLAELANEAPTGGAPAAELWARGKRAHRVRTAAVAATLVVVGAVGIGIGVRLADGDGNRPDVAPAESNGITLPIEYPAGEELPDLGETPGPLAAVWLSPGAEGGIYATDGGAPEAVGLVAATGKFGTLPIDVSFNLDDAFDAGIALSPDGRRIAYTSPTGELVARDVVTGDIYQPAFEFGVRAGYTWVDATHLVGHVAAGSDADGWTWEPGTAPRLVDLYTYPGSSSLGTSAGIDPWYDERSVDHTCQPAFQDRKGPFYELVLCDVVGVIGSETVLTHDGNGRVVAVERPSADYPFEDPAPQVDAPVREVVDTAGSGPLMRVRFATDLIGEALGADDGGAS